MPRVTTTLYTPRFTRIKRRQDSNINIRYKLDVVMQRVTNYHLEIPDLCLQNAPVRDHKVQPASATSTYLFE